MVHKSYHVISQGQKQDSLTLHQPDQLVSPLMLSFPHSGDVYPDDFGYDPALSYSEIDFPSDKYVDELFGRGNELGLASIKANFPRAYLDVNRHQHDIDGAMLEDEEAWYGRLQPTAAKTGTTLFWAISNEKEIYQRKLTLKEAKERLARCHTPYHQAMTSMINRIHEHFGCAYIIDCHSMTQFDSVLRGGAERPQIDIGTRDGESCSQALAEKVGEAFASLGYDVGVNKRFRGGEITLRYGWPEIEQHILQVELRRDLYMNEATRERNENFAKVQQDCAAVIDEVKAFIEATMLR
ncbi:MAG: N-formylglutamate amidohydrolase [Cohaesibacter sp.]|nr:N-formylglutamate amidohydrolase [Cohaesibacter sp.]MCV6600281.1 N-formylglutamate amidohydrolase [Cohaesibacter sp.]